jgi:hypothetical protein
MKIKFIKKCAKKFNRGRVRDKELINLFVDYLKECKEIQRDRLPDPPTEVIVNIDAMDEGIERVTLEDAGLENVDYDTVPSAQRAYYEDESK